MNNQRGFLDSRGEVKRRKKKGHGSTGEKEQSALARSSSPLTSYEVTTGTSSSTAGTDVVKNKAL
ncbi:hypothetical protein Tco_1479099, partial [Tanacetum coccineum]